MKQLRIWIAMAYIETAAFITRDIDGQTDWLFAARGWQLAWNMRREGEK